MKTVSRIAIFIFSFCLRVFVVNFDTDQLLQVSFSLMTLLLVDFLDGCYWLFPWILLPEGIMIADGLAALMILFGSGS